MSDFILIKLEQKGERISDRLRREGFILPFDCGGTGQCGKCIVEIAPATDDTKGVPPVWERVKACQTVIQKDLWIRDSLESIVDLTPVLLEKSLPQDELKGQYGLAFDLGTTTIVVALVNLKTGQVCGQCSAFNPQRSCGSDIISRIFYAGLSLTNRKELQNILVFLLIRMIEILSSHCHVESKQIQKIIAVGNSVMEYLFLGLDPSVMGRVPFQPPQRTFDPVPASVFGFPVNSEALVYPFPLFAGFVGGDIVSGIYSLEEKRPAPGRASIFIDIGTNGELVLIGSNSLLVAATAAGPAFEGAGIEFGMTGGVGAIQSVDFSCQQPLDIIGAVPAKGICGSGLVDAMSEMLRLNIIGRNGRFHKAEDVSPEMADRLTKYGGRPAFRLSEENILPVVITQKDIRQVQLAVGAVRAGIRLLLEYDEKQYDQLDSFLIAGGFGNYLHLKSALQLGLLPPELPMERFKYVGNSALAGAVKALWQTNAQHDILQLTENVEHLELSFLPNFQDLFVESMEFPPVIQ